MIEALFPPSIAVAEMFDDPPVQELFLEEEAFVTHAAPARRQEFLSTRSCARAALARLGISPRPILRGPHGAPMWPDGIVGSMTHCLGYRAAAVARSEEMVTIGMDAEPNEPLQDDDVLRLISLPAERAQLASLREVCPGVGWERLLFSAKESIYKAWYPLTGRWLDFENALVMIDPVSGTFTARLLVPGPVVDGSRMDTLDGRWLANDALVMTAISVRVSDLRPRQ